MKLFSRRNLIVVGCILIVAIVAIGFISLQLPAETVVITPPNIPDQKETSDQIRVRHVNNIQAALSNALKRGMGLPLPDKALEVKFGDLALSHQGQIPTSLFSSIGLDTLQDPVAKTPYLYALSADGKSFEIMTTLDMKDLSNDTGESLSYIAGDDPTLFIRDGKMDVMITSATAGVDVIDLEDMSTRKKFGLPVFKSCLDIFEYKDLRNKLKSGVYTIAINGIDTTVFCDMQTDGGGWTLFYANNGYADSAVKLSYVQMRESLATNPLADLTDYDKRDLAGLLDFTHFTTLGAKEVLARNRTGDKNKWVKFSFSTSRALEWALSSSVLGKVSQGCINIPRRATWSITNNDKSISYTDLNQIMTHTGTSWGVSHEKYLCNDFKKGANPHIAFYNAASDTFENRARSNDGIGGEGGGDNEYRYFVR